MTYCPKHGHLLTLDWVAGLPSTSHYVCPEGCAWEVEEDNFTFLGELTITEGIGMMSAEGAAGNALLDFAFKLVNGNQE